MYIVYVSVINRFYDSQMYRYDFSKRCSLQFTLPIHGVIFIQKLTTQYTSQDRQPLLYISCIQSIQSRTREAQVMTTCYQLVITLSIMLSIPT